MAIRNRDTQGQMSFSFAGDQEGITVATKKKKKVVSGKSAKAKKTAKKKTAAARKKVVKKTKAHTKKTTGMPY